MAMTQPSKIPTADSLRPVLSGLGITISTRRVQVSFLEKDDDNTKDCGVLTWFSGTVMSATDVEGRFEASLEWAEASTMEKTRQHQTNYCLAIGGRTSGWTNTLGSWLNGNKIRLLALLLISA